MAKQKILLIDDEIDFVEIMSKRIESWGYDVIRVFTGKEGLEALKNKSPDIVVVDYMMPDMDGVETLKNIRKTDKKIPVIMFTAFPDKRSIEGTEKLGVSAYIPKVSAFSDVQATLKSAIEMAKRKK